MSPFGDSFDAKRPGSKRFRVLVVDDNEDVGQCLTMLLRQLGYVARACCSGHDCLAWLHAFRPQAILLDLSMPVQDGFETCQLIRQTAGFEDVAIIACSALDPYLVAERSNGCHFSDHLVKPVGLRQLQAAMEQAFDEPFVGVDRATGEVSEVPQSDRRFATPRERDRQRPVDSARFAPPVTSAAFQTWSPRES